MILPEILILPEDMSVRQWVAHAGLDPRTFSSGDSVEKRERISKVRSVRLRRALYMPAIVAIRWEPNIGAFYERLIARGKEPIVAVVAVMGRTEATCSYLQGGKRPVTERWSRRRM